MEITQVRFVLDSFTHYIAEDKVVDFVKGIVGKKVLLVPDDNNEADINCIEGFYMGKACCHVSGRKSLMVRELMRQMNRRSLTEEAMCLWAKAQRANLADEHFQPTMESMRRASILARIMGEKLNLSPLWEPFEELWKVENLDNSNSQAVNANYYPTVVQMVENALK